MSKKNKEFNLNIKMFNTILKCSLIGWFYNISKNTFELYFPKNHCCDMHGAIHFVNILAPDCKKIMTYSGEKPDVMYKLSKGDWIVLFEKSDLKDYKSPLQKIHSK